MNSVPTYIHDSREDNLLAAKRAVRGNRLARMHRTVSPGEDIIDVMVGSDVVERHVCHYAMNVVTSSQGHRFCVEELALYQ